MLQTLFSARGRLITHTIGWALVGLVLFYLIAGMRPVGEALGRTALNLFFPMTLFYVNGRMLINRYFETGQYRRWLLYSVGLWLIMALLRTRLEVLAFGGSLFAPGAAAPDTAKRIFLVVALIYLLLMVFSGLYQLLENRRELEARHTEAQLNYLKAQINPHFLFNTLHNIYAAATLQHPRTPDMVLRLSDLLRYVTYDAQAKRVPLEQEIRQIRAYLDLYQLQAEHPLPIRFDLRGDAGRASIEPLLLLPLVENALKHSDLLTRPDTARVHILLDAAADGLLLRVVNSFLPADRQKDSVGGVGLENIRQRLALHYPARHRFRAAPQGEDFVAEIWVGG
ncbi:MAG TPA: sensor histidine kinase [Saprospiraceae bacterium]|nr:sensor histidine kinase [Saprospiraceae bacterium]